MGSVVGWAGSLASWTGEDKEAAKTIEKNYRGKKITTIGKLPRRPRNCQKW